MTRAAVFAALAVLLALVALPLRAARSPAELLEWSRFLEEKGHLDEALVAAREADEATVFPEATLRVGWLSYRTGAYDAALAAYRRAGLRRAPEIRQEALLGETLVLATLGDADTLAEAAARLTTEFPAEPYGHVRLGYARLLDRELVLARAAYAHAATLDPENVEAALGLAAVARAERDAAALEGACDRVAALLTPTDARLIACRAPLAPALHVIPSTWAYYAAYVRPYTRYWTWSVAAETDLRFLEGAARGLGLDVGLAWSQTALVYEDRDGSQLLPLVGLSWNPDGGRLAGSYLLEYGFGPGRRTEHVVDLVGGGVVGDFWLGGDLATTFSPGRLLLQATPVFGWGAPDALVQVALRPTVAFWARGERGLRKTVHVSGELGLTLAPTDGLWIDAAGWYGRRRNFIEGAGRFVWNADDVLVGGWRLGVRVRVADPVVLTATFRHDVGREGAGYVYDFSLVALQLGAVVTL